MVMGRLLLGPDGSWATPVMFYIVGVIARGRLRRQRRNPALRLVLKNPACNAHNLLSVIDRL
jgi:hypothetical protein